MFGDTPPTAVLTTIDDTFVATGDRQCVLGKPSSSHTICCPAECPMCGGSGCGEFPGCCARAIRESL
jgi:hypothetical protein